MSGGEIAAHLFGATAVASAATWGLLRHRRAMLAGQMAQAFSFATHFALIGAYTGAAMCALSLAQLTFALADRSRLSVFAFWSTAPAIAALTIMTWHGWASGGAALGLALATAGRWQRDPTRLRWCFTAACFAWGWHNAMVASLFGLMTDMFILATNAWRLWRDRQAAERRSGMMIGRLSDRMERQARLMSAMMTRMNVDPAQAARDGHALAAAGRRCLWCGHSAACERWLQDDAAPAPDCPNRAFLKRCAAKG